ncbi:MAG: tRNA (cytidine(56)-2'-O)-methyltransferase [Nanoarchaeota archaeon]
MQIEILRLSHRIRRDPRLSTHVALTARAFLANRLYYSGDKDSSLEETVNKVTEQFGGDFEINYVKDSISLIKEKKNENYLIVHLTVYGLIINSVLEKIKNNKKILIIVGGEKVQPEIFQISDYNISITNQPISEVSALAVFLHELVGGKEITTEFKNAKIKVLPSFRGKKFKK